MKIYDFDKTIYDGDSTIDFYFFVLKENKYLIRYLPLQLYGAIMYMLKLYSKEQFKEKFFSFLKGINEIDISIDEFWNKNIFKIKRWYLVNKQDTDIIISASPEFLLTNICKRLGGNQLIASNVCKYTGEFISLNCYGEEKVKRLQQEYQDIVIDEFFSDSLSDSPLAKKAKCSYIVKKNEIVDWSTYEKLHNRNISNIFLSKQFVQFIFIGCINALNGIVFSYLYSLIVQTNLAFIAGYMTSLAISYILNSLMVFGEKLDILRFIKFSISYMPNFIIQNIVVLILFNILQWNKMLVYAVAAVVGLPITFLALKIFVFKRKNY